MAPIMPMPPDSELPDGPHRDCAGELRRRASQPGAFCPHPGRGGGPGLAVGVRRGAGHVLVTVAGEVDIATVPRLRGQLVALAAGGRPLIADLDRAGFIDAAGLGVLAGAAGRAAAHDDGRRHSGPGLAGQVAFSEWTADGSMRHPGWHGLRAGKGPRAGASRRLRTTRLEDGEGPAR